MPYLTHQTRDPINPEHGKIEVKIPKSLVDHWDKYSNIQCFNLSAAREVLDNPKRIFEGLRTINLGGWCYVGKPSSWNIREGVQVPFPNNLVYCVYMDAGFKIYTFRADPADEIDSLSPKGWQDRFRRLIWKTNP